MTRPLSLRVRVALAAAATLVLAVVLLGGATLALVDRQLHRSLDSGLRDRAIEVTRLAATTPQLITAAGVLEGRVGTSAAFVEVVDRRGRIVARSAALGGRVLPQSAALRRALADRSAGYGEARLGESLCVSTRHRLAGSAVGLRRAGRSLSPARRRGSRTHSSRCAGWFS